MLPLERFKKPPFQHQIEGIEHLLKIKHAALFDEMGIGKTFQVINAACILWEKNEIDVVLIAAPASVRGVWDSPETGEVTKFSWVPSRCIRYDINCKYTSIRPKSESHTLVFVTVSYAYLRSKEKLKGLMRLVRGHKVFLVLDESSAVKSHKSQQSKGAMQLRDIASKCVILNGTPIANNICDLWAQMRIMDWTSINCMNYYHFRAKYARMGGYYNKQIVGINKEEVAKLKKNLAPYILRRLKKDCLDLPEKLFTFVEVEMPLKTWGLYQQMKEDLIASLEGNPSVAQHGAIKAIRLSQMTSGLLGGLTDTDNEYMPMPTERIDTAKIDAFVEWIEDKEFPILVWSRFRKEIEDLEKVLLASGHTVGKIYGGMPDKVRQAVVDDFQAGKLDIVLGQPHAGGLGLTLTRAHIVVYLSNDYSLIARLQSEDRAHRPGQKNDVLYVDFMSVGPDRQKSIDHIVLNALKNKKDLMSCTTNDWVKLLKS